MKRYLNLSLLLDSFFTYICAVIIFLSLFARRFLPMQFRLPIALVVALLPMIAIAYFKIKNARNKESTQNENQAVFRLSEFLTFSSPNEVKSLFKKLFEKINIPCESTTQKTTILSKYNCHFLFYPNDLQQTDIIKAVNTNNPKRLTTIVFGNTFAENCYDNTFLTKANALVIDAKEIYSLLNSCDLLPKTEEVNFKENKFKSLIKNLNDKKRAKRFFYCGCALLLFSLFAFFPLYYTITGCVLLIASLILFLFGKTTTKQTFSLLSLSKTCD